MNLKPVRKQQEGSQQKRKLEMTSNSIQFINSTNQYTYIQVSKYRLIIQLSHLFNHPLHHLIMPPPLLQHKNMSSALPHHARPGL